MGRSKVQSPKCNNIQAAAGFHPLLKRQCVRTTAGPSDRGVCKRQRSAGSVELRVQSAEFWDFRGNRKRSENEESSEEPQRGKVEASGCMERREAHRKTRRCRRD